MKRIALFTFILLTAAGLYAQDCKANMDRTEQMKSALIASHGQGAYFEVNGCHWVPGKNPRDAERGPKISTHPGCANYRDGEKHLLNVPACRKAVIHAQTVKPMPPIVGSYPEGSSTTEVTTASQPLYFLTPDPPCGYGGGVQQDNKGACSLTIILHSGPPEAVCVLGYDDTLHAPVVTCTWKPKEKP